MRRVKYLSFIHSFIHFIDPGKYWSPFSSSFHYTLQQLLLLYSRSYLDWLLLYLCTRSSRYNNNIRISSNPIFIRNVCSLDGEIPVVTSCVATVAGRRQNGFASDCVFSVKIIICHLYYCELFVVKCNYLE